MRGMDFARDFILMKVHKEPSLKMRFMSLRARLFAGAVICLAIFLIVFSRGQDVRANIKSSSLDEWLPASILDHGQSPQEQHVLLRAGDTSQTVLAKLGFSASEAARITHACERVYSLRWLRAGNEWIKRTEANGIQVFYQIDADRQLHLSSTPDGWLATLEPRQASSRIISLEGSIEGSLFTSAAQIGLDDRTTMKLVNIFSWDIDFSRDLRNGDRFRVLLDERFDHGGKLLDRNVLAAEFVSQGMVYRAVRFTLPSGKTDYFTPEGTSLRKAYLRSPVKYSRISSRFSMRRKHPVLGYTRAHKGVDYAAPSGTPVHTIGDGRVVYKGWKGGYGRYVRVRHTNSIHSTVYAHLRRYARAIRKGTRVKQGQVIGYVGMSGLATGPHLHFEFHIRGRAINPLAVRSPAAHPVPDGDKGRFKEVSSRLLVRLMHSTSLVVWS